MDINRVARPGGYEGRKETLMTWNQYLAQKGADWIGKRVIYQKDSAIYTVVGVDHNGGLLIDRPTEHNETTAVETWHVQEI